MQHSKRLAGCLILFCSTLLYSAIIKSNERRTTTATAQQVATPSKLAVLVTDKDRQAVTNLKQEDFLLQENGQARTITEFQQEAPVSYGLVIDNTGSMRSLISPVLEAAKSILSRHRVGDEAFLVRLIDGEAQVKLEWTAKRELLLEQLNTMNDTKGAISLIDALQASSDYITQHFPVAPETHRRRALVLISDGVEKNGNLKFTELLKRLRQKKIQVFPLGIPSTEDYTGGLFAKGTHQLAMDFLRQLADTTASRVVLVEPKTKPQQAGQLVASYLHSQYILGYAPSSANANKPSKIQVKLVDAPNRGKLTVTTWPLT